MKCAEGQLVKVDISGLGLTVSKYLLHDRDRHGKSRYYFRRRGQKKIRLRSQPGTEAFLEEFRRAYNGDHPDQKIVAPVPPAGPARKNPPKGSLAWLFNEYERSGAFRDLGATTKARRRVIMDQICAESTSDNNPAPVGLRPLELWRPKTVRVICERCLTPATVNARLKAFREAFKLAVADEHMSANPAKEVRYKVSKSGGYHTWTVEDVAQYEARWPLGTVQRLALAILIFTGTRRSDAVVLGKQHRKTVGGVPGLQFLQFKGRERTPVTTWIPLLPVLQEVIDATPTKSKANSVLQHTTFLETSFGKPFTAKGFGTQFKKWCKLAGLPHCSAHGLRKASATVLAERGATAHQLMAIFGWRSINQALVYTRAAEQKLLAAAAMHMLAPADVSHPEDDSGKMAIGGTVMASK